MPWKTMEVQEQRVEFVVRRCAGRSRWCAVRRVRHLSSHRGYLWIQRYREGGVAAIAERSRRPHQSPAQTPSEPEERVRRAAPGATRTGVRASWPCCLTVRASSCPRVRYTGSCCAMIWCASRTGTRRRSSALSASGPTSSGRWTSRGRRTGRTASRPCR